MQTDEALRGFCVKLLSQKQDELESIRKKSGHQYYRIVYTVIIVFVISAIVLGVIGESILILVLLFVLGPIFFGLLAFYLKSIREEYKVSYKRGIIPEMIRFYNENLSYYPEKGILFQAVEVSNLFTSGYNFESSDYVEGQIGETFIQFSPIKFGLSQSLDPSAFEGMFMIVTFNKNFNGRYLIVPGIYNKIIGGILSKTIHGLTGDSPEQIQMENEDFNRLFSVYGTDQIEARYILTPSMIQRMVDFRNSVNENVYFSFTRSRLFIAFEMRKKTLYEPDFSSNIDVEDLVNWGRGIQLALGVVDEFKLNTRIWSKG